MRSLARWAGLAILALAAVRLAWVAIPHMDKSPDFRTPWLSSRAWMIGKNPYDHALLERIRLDLGGDPADHLEPTRTPSVYLPTTFIVIAPFAAMGWEAARACWLIASAALLAWALIEALRLGRLSFAQSPPSASSAEARPPDSLVPPSASPGAGMAWLFIGLALLLGPVSVCLQLGQPTLADVAMVIIAVGLASRGWDIAAGMLLAIATLLKPQIGGVVWVFYLLARRWRLAGACAAVLLLMTAAALARLQFAGVPWLSEWLARMAEVGQAGGFNDPSMANTRRYEMINLQMLFSGITRNAKVVTAATGFVTAALVAAWLWLYFRAGGARALHIALPAAAARPGVRQPARGFALPALCAMLMISLLPVYHRYYDALLMLLILCWALGAVREPRLRAPAICAIILTAPFYVSWGELSGELVKRWWVSEGAAGTLWSVFVTASQVWAVLAMSIVLLWAMWRAGSAPTAGPTPKGTARAPWA